MTEPLRVAVTGAAGYLAGRLIRELDSAPNVESILAMDIRPPREPLPGGVEFVRQDITEPFADIFTGQRVNTVVHLAYVLNPGHRRSAARRVNVDGTGHVLEACAASGASHIMYLSSTSVYGAWPDNPVLLTEEDPVRPLRRFQYSEDKVAAESQLFGFAERNPSTTVTVLRGCPVMGPNADNFIAGAFRKPVLPAVGGNDPPMQFVHEDDLVRVLTACLSNRPSGTFNLAADGMITWSQMAEVMGRRLIRLPAWVWYGLTWTGWNLRLQSDAPPVGLNFIRYRWTTSAEKLKRELGFEFRYTSSDAWRAYAERSEP